MISKRLVDAFSEQINRELYSEYFYLAMAAWLDAEGFSGCANFFKVQVEEERFHAMKMYGFVNERGGRVDLKAIEKPQTEFDSVLEIFEKAYAHEQLVTKLINELMDVTIEEKDHAAKSFLNWFVDEQVEEEASMEDVVNKLKMIKGSPNALFMLDQAMGKRSVAPSGESEPQN